MAQCNFPAGIEGVSGTLSKHRFITPEGAVTKRVVVTCSKRTGKQRIYIREYKPRTTPVSAKEQQNRQRMTEATTLAGNLALWKKNAYARDWKESNGVFNGKKYATIRGYLIARIYAELKESDGVVTRNKSVKSPLKVR